MRYRLLLLTHGDHDEDVRTTLRSFHEHVMPKPSDYVCVRDGCQTVPPMNPDGQGWRYVTLLPQQGFCKAVRAAWRAAALPGADYVFWLEHDFVFLRDVDLVDWARVLDQQQQLSQMHAIRGPVNRREERAGGIVELQPESYVKTGQGWMQHQLYFTTNPSLIRREFVVENPWTQEDSECEGKFSWELRARGYTTGAWGDGEPWVEHIGARDGFGY